MAYYRNPSDVTALPAWQALSKHRQSMQNFSMREAFNSDPQRFSQFTLSSAGLFLDYSSEYRSCTDFRRVLPRRALG